MRTLLKLVIVPVLALGVLAEIAVIPLAESQMESKVAERTDGEAAVSADIDSFPLITSVLLTGKVRGLSVTLDEVARQRLTFAEVRFDVSGIAVDRAAILRREVKITDIDSGTITAALELGRLGSVFRGIQSFLEGSGLRDRIGGVSVEDGDLVVGGSRFPLANDLFPCDPEAVLDDESVTLTCTITEVPDVLRDAEVRF